MTLGGKQRLFAKLVGEFLVWIYKQGYEVTLGEVLRTPEQQKIYIEEGLSKTFNSMHLYKLAIDINLFINGEYQTEGESYRPLGEYWEKLGLESGVVTRWGGRFGINSEDYDKKVGWDAGHMELQK